MVSYISILLVGYLVIIICKNVNVCIDICVVILIVLNIIFNLDYFLDDLRNGYSYILLLFNVGYEIEYS